MMEDLVVLPTAADRHREVGFLDAMDVDLETRADLRRKLPTSDGCGVTLRGLKALRQHLMT